MRTCRPPSLPSESRSAMHRAASARRSSAKTAKYGFWPKTKRLSNLNSILSLCKKFRNMSMHGPRSAPRRRIELAIERACSQVRGRQLDPTRPLAQTARASRYGIRCAREASKTPLFAFVSLARAIPHGSRRGWRRWKALGAPDDLR